MTKLLNWMKPWHKTMVAFLLDTSLAVFAFPMAFLLRYGTDFLDVVVSHRVIDQTLLIIAVQVGCFYIYGMYKGIWRYASIPDFIRLAKGITIATLFSALLLFFYNRLESTPRSIFVIDWLLLLTLLGGWRVLYRILRDYSENFKLSDEKRRVVVIGAGSGGEQLIREIKKSPSMGLSIVAVLDDDPGKQKKLLHGMPILGYIDDLAKIAKNTGATLAYIAIPTADNELMKKIVSICQKANLDFKTLPPIDDIKGQKINLNLLRDVNPEDLLGRNQVELDRSTIKDMIQDKVILVTGAGGSIGSEICRQLAPFKPKQLILFEASEFNLYELDLNLRERFPQLNFKCCIGDVRNVEHVSDVFETYLPEVVFHAAAYKHVPLMEVNPKAAIETNTLGTEIVALFATKHNAKKFVLISTDKAVNPTNFMGASKRLAEMVCSEYHKKQSTTKFVTVRFGNVLGSSGSVIPRFKKQIARGGPVTVTHPEITRFFMSIAEAAQLVLQAGSLGRGGEIFVLDMGQPIKILDLAKQLISLSGKDPEKEIKIEFTGLRPGEKLYEEVLFQDELNLPTSHPLLKAARVRQNESNFSEKLNRLRENLPELEVGALRETLQSYVPEFQTPETVNQKKLREKELLTENESRSIH